MEGEELLFYTCIDSPPIPVQCTAAISTVQSAVRVSFIKPSVISANKPRLIQKDWGLYDKERGRIARSLRIPNKRQSRIRIRPYSLYQSIAFLAFVIFYIMFIIKTFINLKILCRLSLFTFEYQHIPRSVYVDSKTLQ